MLKPIILLTITLSVASAEITVKHVNGTTTPYTWAQLQNAIDDPLTVCGDIIEITPGASRQEIYGYLLRGPAMPHVFGGPLVAPSYAKDCASSGKYITIRSSKAYQLTPGKRVGSADVANLAFIGLSSDDGCVIFETERAASFYRLQGLELASTPRNCESGGSAMLKITYAMPATGAAGLTRLDSFPNHITIDQCWIHGIDSFEIRDGMQMEGMSVNLINSTIENIRTNVDSGQESHGLISVHGRGPIRIVNNQLTGGMNNVFFGGFPSISKRPMEYIEFANNWLYRPFKMMDWHGTDADPLAIPPCPYCGGDPTPLSPCPVDSDAHGATYRNTSNVTYWECQGAAPGTWTQIDATTYNALIAVRIPTYDKNIFEAKSITKMHAEGNMFDRGYSLNSAGQLGGCWMFNLVDGPFARISYLQIENNICQHATWALGQGHYHTTFNPDNDPFWDNGQRAFHHILFRNNLFQSMGEDMYTMPLFGLESPFAQSSGFAQFGHHHGDAFTLDHVTFEGRLTTGYNFLQNIGVRSDAAYEPALPGINQRVINSIWTAGHCPIGEGYGGSGCNANATATTWGPYAEMAANGIVDNLGIGLTNLDDTRWHCVPGSTGCAYTTAFDQPPPNCLGCMRLYSTPTQAKFVSFPNDLTLQSNSPFKAAGLDGKDLGADLNTVGWATAGAQAGTLAPYLAMKIRGIVPAATSVAVRFSAVDTSSCTVTVRKYGFPLSSPVATATDNTGTLDRFVTLTGLSGSTKYGLKVTCAGTYYREDEFRTP